MSNIAIIELLPVESGKLKALSVEGRPKDTPWHVVYQKKLSSSEVHTILESDLSLT